MEETVEVIHARDDYEFVINVDGEEAGITEYRMGPGVRAFMHTVVDEKFQGRGLASRLVRQALEETRAEGLLVEPYCPYTRGFIEKHPEYLDLVPEDRREGFGLGNKSKAK
jgi:predicted GNAT family acetyltransferase